MADRFDEMAARVQLDMESYAMRQSIDGRGRVLAEALRAAHTRGVNEGAEGLDRARFEAEALRRGMDQMRLIAGLPVHPRVKDALLLARDALDRLMGDSDLAEDDSIEMRAMRAISRALDAEAAQ